MSLSCHILILALSKVIICESLVKESSTLSRLCRLALTETSYYDKDVCRTLWTSVPAEIIGYASYGKERHCLEEVICILPGLAR